MNYKNRHGLVGAFVITLTCLALVSISGAASSAAGPVAQTIIEPLPVRVIALPWDAPFRIPPPPGFGGPRAPRAPTASFTITYVPNGTGDGQGATCLTWNSNAQTAFNYAASIWSTLIKSSVPIKIQACWANLGSSSILGYSWSSLTRDFTGAPVPGTWYSYTLADALAGSDLSPGNVDFYITLNNGFSWYLGTDGNTPMGQYDFVSVVLHEIGHGLNFAGSMAYGSPRCTGANNGCWGYGTGYPNIYDRFVENGTGQALLDTGFFPNPSAALGSQLTSNNLYFDGINANAANSGNRVKIYAPTTWASGSSYSHLDYATFAGTPNRLMVYAIPSASSIHDPGSVMMGVLNDVGWKSTVLVDDNYNSSTPGWNYTHFASIQDGINAVPIGGTVVVYAGTYNESVTLNKLVTVALEGNVTVGGGGSLSINAGTFTATNGNLMLTGNLTYSGGTFNHNSGTFIFGGSGTQTVSGNLTVNNLTVNNGVTVDVGSNVLTVNGILTNNGVMKRTTPMQNQTTGVPQTYVDAVNRTTARLTSTGGTALGNTNIVITMHQSPSGGNAPCDSVTLGGQPVLRHFNITPQNTSGVAATVRLYFASSELNTNDLANLGLFHCNGTTWQRASGTLSATGPDSNGYYYVEVPNVTSFSPFAIGGGSSAPTAVTLSSFTGNADARMVDGALILGVLAAGVVSVLAVGGVGRARRKH